MLNFIVQIAKNAFKLGGIKLIIVFFLILLSTAIELLGISLIIPIIIRNPEVVSKSYSNFWNDLKSVGFHISKK